MDTHPTAHDNLPDRWDEARLHAALASVAFANPHAAARALLRWAADARVRPALTALLPHLLSALRQVNAELQKIITRLEES